MWKVLNEEVDLGEPTSFFDHVFLQCTQRQCEISKDMMDNYRAMFESRISAGTTDTYERHRSLTMLIRVTLNENVEHAEILWTIIEIYLSPETLLEMWGKYQKPEFRVNLVRTLFLHGLMIWEVMPRKCVERYCELANKRTQQWYKVATTCLDDHHFKEEEIGMCWKIVKSVLTNCSKQSKFSPYWRT